MDSTQLEIVVVLPFLLLGVALVAAFAWVPEPSAAAERPERPRSPRERLAGLVQLVGTWFVLTTLTIWCVALVAFFALHAVLFSLGQGVASVALFLIVVLLEVTPFAWAAVIVHRARRSRPRNGLDEAQDGPPGR